MNSTCLLLQQTGKPSKLLGFREDDLQMTLTRCNLETGLFKRIQKNLASEKQKLSRNTETIRPTAMPAPRLTNLTDVVNNCQRVLANLSHRAIPNLCAADLQMPNAIFGPLRVIADLDCQSGLLGLAPYGFAQLA